MYQKKIKKIKNTKNIKEWKKKIKLEKNKYYFIFNIFKLKIKIFSEVINIRVK